MTKDITAEIENDGHVMLADVTRYIHEGERTADRKSVFFPVEMLQDQEKLLTGLLNVVQHQSVEIMKLRQQLNASDSLLLAKRMTAARMTHALLGAKRLHDEALPRLDWGKSALDAKAIGLLNDIPILVNSVLKEEGAL